MNRKHFLRSFACTTVILSLGIVPALASTDSGTADEAKAMTKRGAALIKAKGADAAYAEFVNGATFKDRDLYVTVFDLKGNCLAHGANPKLSGKNLWELKDANGVAIVQMMTAFALAKNEGWAEPYLFPNPLTKSMQPKTNYVQRVGDTFLFVGYYK